MLDIRKYIFRIMAYRGNKELGRKTVFLTYLELFWLMRDAGELGLWIDFVELV